MCACAYTRARARKRELMLNCSRAVLRPRRRQVLEVLSVWKSRGFRGCWLGFVLRPSAEGEKATSSRVVTLRVHSGP